MRLLMSAGLKAFAFVLGLTCAWSTGSPVRAAETAAAKPLPAETATFLKSRSVAESAPLYIRVFKEESELEVWKARANGRYLHIKTFPICNWSGALGPKQKLGDLMSPEGFYGVGREGLKPDSKYHLALNIGYPNALDRSLGRSGDFIMVHGKCVSVGCFAMTDELIEEVYAFVREALDAGQERVPVHVFPFRMSATNLKAHAGEPSSASWQPLKEAYDDFARTREPPRVALCGQRYIVNPLTPVGTKPDAACPAQIGKLMAPLSPKQSKRLTAAGAAVIEDGPKTRTPDNIASWDRSIADAATSESAERDENRQKLKNKAVQFPAEMGSMTPFLAQ
jgi:murein L,D-transpeptidase YafK